MISTLLSLQEVANDSLHDIEVKMSAQELISMREDVSDETFVKALFHYSANLVSIVASGVSAVLLTVEEMNSLFAASAEMDEMALNALLPE